MKLSLIGRIHLYYEKCFLLTLEKFPGSFKNSYDGGSHMIGGRGRSHSLLAKFLTINNQCLFYQNCPKNVGIQKEILCHTLL